MAITWFINIWIFTVTPTILFILGAFTGLVFSPTFPLSFGFINQRLNVNPLLLGCLLCGSAIGAMFFQKIAGKLSLLKNFYLYEKLFFLLLFHKRLFNGY